MFCGGCGDQGVIRKLRMFLEHLLKFFAHHFEPVVASLISHKFVHHPVVVLNRLTPAGVYGIVRPQLCKYLAPYMQWQLEAVLTVTSTPHASAIAARK